ncbi:uncharacterized protein PFL1_00789 [Pseudozyma flocculosa PF-1]|uniref:uncharacterized protein n=1 Tax=Pseudozyma flocculosa PF-1 TaxID=1277687 RepID=UPI0004561122|nr:uncharacterized protein PFL1_00789 [Pseudozyma flocculosa PF-1]EPQ31454.1 hypothetical protein PFL1_00789 [Pseudozyma flocculosa PF-1]
MSSQPRSPDRTALFLDQGAEHRADIDGSFERDEDGLETPRRVLEEAEVERILARRDGDDSVQSALTDVFGSEPESEDETSDATLQRARGKRPADSPEDQHLEQPSTSEDRRKRLKPQTERPPRSFGRTRLYSPPRRYAGATYSTRRESPSSSIIVISSDPPEPPPRVIVIGSYECPIDLDGSSDAGTPDPTVVICRGGCATDSGSEIIESFVDDSSDDDDDDDDKKHVEFSTKTEESFDDDEVDEDEENDDESGDDFSDDGSDDVEAASFQRPFYHVDNKPYRVASHMEEAPDRRAFDKAADLDARVMRDRDTLLASRAAQDCGRPIFEVAKKHFILALQGKSALYPPIFGNHGEYWLKGKALRWLRKHTDPIKAAKGDVGANQVLADKLARATKTVPMSAPTFVTRIGNAVEGVRRDGALSSDYKSAVEDALRMVIDFIRHLDESIDPDLRLALERSRFLEWVPFINQAVSELRGQAVSSKFWTGRFQKLYPKPVAGFSSEAGIFRAFTGRSYDAAFIADRAAEGVRPVGWAFKQDLDRLRSRPGLLFPREPRGEAWTPLTDADLIARQPEPPAVPVEDPEMLPPGPSSVTRLGRHVTGLSIRVGGRGEWPRGQGPTISFSGLATAMTPPKARADLAGELFKGVHIASIAYREAPQPGDAKDEVEITFSDSAHLYTALVMVDRWIALVGFSDPVLCPVPGLEGPHHPLSHLSATVEVSKRTTTTSIQLGFAGVPMEKPAYAARIIQDGFKGDLGRTVKVKVTYPDPLIAWRMRGKLATWVTSEPPGRLRSSMLEPHHAAYRPPNCHRCGRIGHSADEAGRSPCGGSRCPLLTGYTSSAKTLVDEAISYATTEGIYACREPPAYLRSLAVDPSKHIGRKAVAAWSLSRS